MYSTFLSVHGKPQELWEVLVQASQLQLKDLEAYITDFQCKYGYPLEWDPYFFINNQLEGLLLELSFVTPLPESHCYRIAKLCRKNLDYEYRPVSEISVEPIQKSINLYESADISFGSFVGGSKSSYQ